jgi:hypothetical protein
VLWTLTAALAIAAAQHAGWEANTVAGELSSSAAHAATPDTTAEQSWLGVAARKSMA